MFHRKRFGTIAILIMLLCSWLSPLKTLAAGAEMEMSIHAAVRALQANAIVDKGSEADLRLGDQITRAEFAKVLVAAMGETKQADSLKLIPAFPDTDGHWANGWVAVAKSRGVFQGRGDGRFDPEAKVTYAEAATALLRLVGRGSEASLNWPWGAVSSGLGLGIIPSDLELTGKIMNAATRGDVFRMTAIAIGRVTLLGSGETLLQTLQDTTPPILALDDFPAQTNQGSIMVGGMAGDAVTVSVSGKYADVLPDGTFSVALELAPGDNPMDVIAMDAAGNRAEAQAHIMYQRLARIEIQPLVIQTTVGSTFSATVTRYDETGRSAVTNIAAFSYDTSAMTRDPKTGLFKALQSGEFTLRANLDGYQAQAQVVTAGAPSQIEMQVDRPIMAAGSTPAAVHVRILDDQGRLNTAGNISLNVVTIPAGVATPDNKTLKTNNGVATFYMIPGQTPGEFGLQVTSSGSGGVALQSATVPISMEARRLVGIKLQPVPANFAPRAGQPISIIATAVDQNGAPIPVTDDATIILRSAADSGVGLTTATAIIKKGTASSDFGGQNGAGTSTGRVGVSQVSGSFGTLPVTAATVNTQHSDNLTHLGVTVVQGSAQADDTSAAIVTVSRLDDSGAVVSWDQTPIVLFSATSTISRSKLSDAGGVATYAIRSSAAGRVSLTAGVPGRSELNTDPVEVAFVKPVGPAPKPTLVSDVKSLPAGGVVTLSVDLTSSSGGSSSGAAMANPGPALIYDLTTSGGGILSETRVVIPSGATGSPDVKLNVPLGVASQLTVTATLLGGKPLSPLAISVSTPSPKPPQNFTGSNLAVVVPGGTQSVAGQESRFLVQVWKDNVLLQDSYAFKLNVLLNGKLLTALPDNLQVKLGARSVIGLTGRTTDGQAEIWVKYTGTGIIEIDPVPANLTPSIPDQYGALGAGLLTTRFKTPTKAQVVYVAAPLDHMNVSVSPTLGDPLQGVLKASPGRYATVRLSPVDIFGNFAPGNCIASLTKKDGSADNLNIRLGDKDLSDLTSSVTTDGYAEYAIYTNSDSVGSAQWSPSIICGSTVLSAGDVKISTTLAAVQTASIESLGGDESGERLFSSNDTVLNLRIARLPAVSGPMALLVYDGTAFVGSYGPVDPSSSNQSLRSISIPKSAFGTTAKSLNISVRLNSGAEVSAASSAAPIYYNYTP